ncbi:chitobiase/beta-hexosaminidase C-terminal domain-containing protein [Leucobacter sp. HY1910]
MTRKRRVTALALGGIILFGGQAAIADTTVKAWASDIGLAAPEVSLESGRYVDAQTVTLTAPAGTEIRYTLDGTEPTRASALYEAPIQIEASVNLTAVAFMGTAQSEPVMRGLIIKTAEEPAAQFAVMSDIHLSSSTDALDKKWQQYFDTLTSIMPNPDAIISNGDQINDNNYNTASDHKYPRAMFESNLARTGMDSTDVLMTFGNHDDRVNRMFENYPREWFPSEKGYYETTIGGFPAFIVNTESWGSAQATWLYERLTELTEDAATQGQPIFVFGHKPLPNTVWDGAQASNAGLKSNLNDFPQVVFFSGHSHLNITDERSIHQDTFTSVNEGSMSYEETDSVFQTFGNGLAKEHTIPTAQSVLVEVYDDRIEIDRINYAADHGRTYTPEGAWSFQQNPPFSSTGTLAGPSWVIERGDTPQETKSKFRYTAQNRNGVAPEWTAEQPSVDATENGLMLVLPQAVDDQYVKDYSLQITDVETGEAVNLLPTNGRISADYVFAPRQATLQVPLQVRKDNKVGQPIDRKLTAGQRYEATLVAYDSYGNKSPSRSFTFVAQMEIQRDALDAVTELASPVIARLSRVLGEPDQAQPQDFQVHVTDLAEAQKLATSLTGLFAQEYVAQSQLDRAVARAQQQLESLNSLFTPVQRTVLERLVEEAEAALAGTEVASEALQAQVADAKQMLGALNISQDDIDAATERLATALQEFEESVLDRSVLVTAVTAAVTQANTVERVLGVLTPAVAADYALFIEDVAGASDAVAEVRALIAAAPIGVEHVQGDSVNPAASSDALTQESIDAAAQTLNEATARLAGFAVDVNRSALQAAVQSHADLVAKASDSTLAEAQTMVSAHREALALLGELNRSQAAIDAAESGLAAAARAFSEALATETPGGGEANSGGDDSTADGGSGGATDETENPKGDDGGSGTADVSSAAGGPSAGSGELAETGATGVWTLAVIASLLAASGAALLRRRTRRG